MSTFIKKLSTKLSELHAKEAEEYNLITGNFITYKMGETYIAGDEIIVPDRGMFRLSSLPINKRHLDIEPKVFAYLPSALTYSVAYQRGWINICLLVEDRDKRMAEAEHDVHLFKIKSKKSLEKKDFEKNAIYVARLSAAQSHYTKIKNELSILSKKARYIQRQ